MAGGTSRLNLPAARERRALIELCYRLDLDDAAFLGALGAWWQRQGPEGPLGVVAASLRCDDAGRLELDPRGYGHRVTFDVARSMLAVTARPTAHAITSARPQIARASELPNSASALSLSRAHGAGDFVGLLCPTGAGSVVLIGTPVERSAVVLPADRAAMDACASHLAAAWRLRRRLSAQDRWDDRAEAVARPDGSILHAIGEARAPGALATLRAMVRARERARAGNRVDSDPLWPELVAGRWTLVDVFDEGGRRYVVAYRNPPDAPPTQLSPHAREVLTRTARGEPSKVIAAALGVGEADVSMTLRRAMKALRIERVADLIRLGGEARPEVVFCDEALTALALAPAARLPLDALTAAEREVLAAMVRGATNRDIAAARNRSERTVANQVASVFAKLGVDSRRGLLAKLAGR